MTLCVSDVVGSAQLCSDLYAALASDDAPFEKVAPSRIFDPIRAASGA
jgi:hypothetical protein